MFFLLLFGDFNSAAKQYHKIYFFFSGQYNMVLASRLLMSLARWGKWSEKISVKTVYYQCITCLCIDTCSIFTWIVTRPCAPNAKPGVKRKKENIATKADKRKQAYEDKRDHCFQEHWLEKNSMVATREGYEVHNLLQLLR